ncbi:MAG: MutS-related protein [Methanobacteriaceae archaeon]
MGKVNLKEIDGVGEKLSAKIIHGVGGEEELEKIVSNLDLEKIASIEGISQRRAVEIMNKLLGNPSQQFLKSERAIQIYEEIIQKIINFSNTKYSENKILLLSPSKDKKLIEERLEFIENAKNKVATLPIDQIRRLLKKVELPKNKKPEYDASKAILVESSEDQDYLMELGLNKYHPIITASENIMIESELQNYDLVFYVYTQGFLAIEEAENLIMVNKESSVEEIIPEIVLNYFNENKKVFETVYSLRTLLKLDSTLGEVLEIIDEVDDLKVKNIDLDKIVSSAKDDGDIEIKKLMQNVDLEGDEVLNLLNNEMPPKLEKIFDKVISKLRETIKGESGINFDPFLKKYPLEIDEEEMERIKQQENSKKENDLFDKKVIAANRLSDLKQFVEEEVREILEFDYEFTLGCFAYYYNLNKPILSDNEFSFKQGLHLELALEDNEYIQRIDYELTESDNIALLTGANSGGKTTLLETAGQIAIMTHIGLPVCAEKANIKLLDEIYHFSKGRSLDAGAFESFLNVFMPIVTTDKEKLVLLDELEGITELDAAVKIISSFISMIDSTNSFGIIVTHMARELMKYTEVRVDGIEAKGLDKNYNLIVDRTPRMNYLARSTPELILKRIYENSEGRLKEVYKEILKKF